LSDASGTKGAVVAVTVGAGAEAVGLLVGAVGGGGGAEAPIARPGPSFENVIEEKSRGALLFVFVGGGRSVG
jgi:hypothetical protein